MKTLTLIALLVGFFTSSLIAEEKSPAGQLVDLIQGLLDFYNTPLGAKFIETLPAITAESVTLGQTVAMKHQASFQKELERIIGEHMGAEAAPPKKAIEKE